MPQNPVAPAEPLLPPPPSPHAPAHMRVHSRQARLHAQVHARPPTCPACTRAHTPPIFILALASQWTCFISPPLAHTDGTSCSQTSMPSSAESCDKQLGGRHRKYGSQGCIAATPRPHSPSACTHACVHASADSVCLSLRSCVHASVPVCARACTPACRHPCGIAMCIDLCEFQLANTVAV